MDAPPDDTTAALVIAGGRLTTTPDPEPSTRVIAADSGYDHAVRLGIPVDLLVGDMDSISAAGLAHAEAAGVRIERYPEAKDATDLELALEAAVALGATSIDVHGGEGGRIAHLLGVALELTDARWRELRIRWHTGTGTVHVAMPERPVTVTGAIGDTVSLIPVGDVGDVATSGLRWPLDGDALAAGTSRGLSNELTAPAGSVSVGTGTLLVVVEGDHA